MVLFRNFFCFELFVICAVWWSRAQRWGLPSSWSTRTHSTGPLIPPQRENDQHYVEMQDKYREYISGNELLRIPLILKVVAVRTTSLLAADVKTRKLIGEQENNGLSFGNPEHCSQDVGKAQ